MSADITPIQISHSALEALRHFIEIAERTTKACSELRSALTLATKENESLRIQLADATDFRQMCSENQQAREMLSKFRATKDKMVA